MRDVCAGGAWVRDVCASGVVTSVWVGWCGGDICLGELVVIRSRCPGAKFS